MNWQLFEALQPSWAKALLWLSALTQMFALLAGGTRLESDQTNSGFLKKAKPLRCSWFQLLRVGKLAGKLAVIECC